VSSQSDYHGFNAEQIDIIRGMCPPNVPERDFKNFLYYCKEFKLNPIRRQAYLVPRGKGENLKWSAESSIDGLRLNAERTGRYAPGRAATWELDSNGHPVSATAYIMKLAGNTWLEVSHTVFYEEFVQTFYNKDKKRIEPNQFWSRMPRQMLAKVAEAFCLRKAFPDELGGLYTPEEMGIDAIPIEDAKTITHSDKETKPTKQYNQGHNAKDQQNELDIVYNEVIQFGKTLKEIKAEYPPFPVKFKQLSENEQRAYRDKLKELVFNSFESQYLAAISNGAITAQGSSQFENWQSFSPEELCRTLILLRERNNQSEINKEIKQIGTVLKGINVVPAPFPKPWNTLTYEEKAEYYTSLENQLIKAVNDLADQAAESEILTPGEVEESGNWTLLPIESLIKKAQDLFARINKNQGTV